MMRRSLILSAACVACASAAHAHHGIANFDLNSDIALEGTITRVDFINPHSWLHFDVTGPDGKVTPWRCGAERCRRAR